MADSAPSVLEAPSTSDSMLRSSSSSQTNIFRCLDDESEPGHFSLYEAELKLLFDGTHADCKVKCQSHVWNVHQAILCPRNAYFDRALNGGFKERETKILEWDDEDPFAVEGLLIYLYTGRYPRGLIRIPEAESELSELEVHLKLLVIADKRQADSLQALATEKVAHILETSRDATQFTNMIEQLRASEIPLAPLIGESAATAACAGLKNRFPANALWPEGSLERGVISGLLKEVEKARSVKLNKLREVNKIVMSIYMLIPTDRRGDVKTGLNDLRRVTSDPELD